VVDNSASHIPKKILLILKEYRNTTKIEKWREQIAAMKQLLPVLNLSLSEANLFSRSQQSLLRVLACWLILTLLEIINMSIISNRDDFSSIQFGYYINSYYV
jgi:hypothetical protein